MPTKRIACFGREPPAVGSRAINELARISSSDSPLELDAALLLSRSAGLAAPPSWRRGWTFKFLRVVKVSLAIAIHCALRSLGTS